MAMSSCKIVLLLFVRFNVCYGLYASYQSEAASVPPANTAGSQGKGGISSGTIVALVVSISVAVLILLVGICYLSKRKRKSYDSDSEGIRKDPHDIQESYDSDSEGISQSDIRNSGLLQYDFITIEAATNNFCSAYEIHEGVHYNIYLGMLPNGQEISVEKFKIHAVEEFKNELEVHAKLQHRNLARPVGLSVEGDEKILVYDYYSYQNLGQILSNPKRGRGLDWAKRYRIAKGIAQGIQYLHGDSRFRIIHRNIKSSSILLDNDMNPIIMDFGLAIMFLTDENKRWVTSIAGTRDYMALELKFEVLSGKCDVYSFGVVLMEIISRRGGIWRNQKEGTRSYLVDYAWHLWINGQALKLLDPTIRESYNPNEVMRCIQVAMLCVQEDPTDRPSMASVVLMLENYSMTLPSPSPSPPDLHKIF